MVKMLSIVESFAYDKSKPFFDYEATVGSVIAVIKKATKVSDSEGGFKIVVSKKKRKGCVLTKSVDNSEVADKALGNCSWGSEMGDTTKSESINMEEECLVEKTSVDYGKNGAFNRGDPDQTPKSLHVKTKKMLGKPLGVIDYGTINVDNDVLDGSFLFPPSLPIKPSVQVPVHKSFALDINLVAAIVLKEIPVRTSIEAVHAAISEFGLIKSIKMQLVGLWQKAIIELEDQIQADLLAAKWFVLIGKDAVHVARANVDKQTWDARDEFRALLYTLPMGTTTHDLWDFIGLVGGKTCVIERSSVSYVWACCATVCFDSEGSLIQAMANTPVINGKICPVSCPLAFGEKTWASVVGKPLPLASFSGSAQSGSVSYGKPLPTVSVSQSSPGCQLLVTPSSQNQEEDIVMEVGSDDATSNKTAAITGSTASPEIVKLENMLEDLSALVMSLSAHLNGLALAGGALPLPLSQ
ncbi:hypothetical protein G9A89_005859 [Geosiphon pyriformis]|nr:hypothetical protein G9A89_005859 [Geosiphon pyriformis]